MFEYYHACWFCGCLHYVQGAERYEPRCPCCDTLDAISPEADEEEQIIDDFITWILES